MAAQRLAFLDWMKAVGMFLIVFGHVVGGQVNLVTPPIYHKQLGVTLFMFVSGYTLARETRPTWRVVVNRLFEILLITGLSAVVSSVASFSAGGRGLLSNYLPFLFGANLLLNDFPANPTTWYVGTYIHAIAVWAVARRFLRPTPTWLAASLVVEVLVRAALWRVIGPFVAYMALFNWMTVFLLGMYAGREGADMKPRWLATVAATVAVAVPLAVGAWWSFDRGFPLRALPAAGEWSPLVASVGVSLLYVGATWLAFVVTSRLGRSALVEWLAAQTVFIFVAHMPVYFGLFWLIGSWPRWARAVPLVVTCYFVVAAAGAVLYRWLQPTALRERLIGRVAPRLGLSSAA